MSGQSYPLREKETDSEKFTGVGSPGKSLAKLKTSRTQQERTISKRMMANSNSFLHQPNE